LPSRSDAGSTAVVWLRGGEGESLMVEGLANRLLDLPGGQQPLALPVVEEQAGDGWRQLVQVELDEVAQVEEGNRRQYDHGRPIAAGDREGRPPLVRRLVRRILVLEPVGVDQPGRDIGRVVREGGLERFHP